jgi:LPS-assembly lipoprotein
MSSSSRALRERGRVGVTIGAILCSVLALASLSACGFRPLYAPAGDTGGPVADLAAVTVERIDDRPGQELRNQLVDLLNPGRLQVPPRYRLDVKLEEELKELAVERSGFATRANLRMEASYALYAGDGTAPLVRNQSRVVSSYNIGDARFSTLTANEAARSRALRQIAYDIRARLAAYFAATPAGGAPAAGAAPAGS